MSEGTIEVWELNAWEALEISENAEQGTNAIKNSKHGIDVWSFRWHVIKSVFFLKALFRHGSIVIWMVYVFCTFLLTGLLGTSNILKNLKRYVNLQAEI